MARTVAHVGDSDALNVRALECPACGRWGAPADFEYLLRGELHDADPTFGCTNCPEAFIVVPKRRGMRTLLLNQDGIVTLAHTEDVHGHPRHFNIESQRGFRAGGQYVVARKQGRVLAE